MKKRLWSAILALAMIVSMMPAALAEGDDPDAPGGGGGGEGQYVAKIKDTQYATLGAAIDEAQGGDTITLLSDVTISESITFDLTGIIIETDGHTINIGEEGGSSSVEVTITGNGQIKNTNITNLKPHETTAGLVDDPRRLLEVFENTSLTIENGTFDTQTYEVLRTQGETLIKDGTFTCSRTDADDEYDSWCAMVARGEKAKLTIEAGTINAPYGTSNCGLYGVYAAEGAEIVLGTENGEGPSITAGMAAIGMNNHTSPATITVNGGTYKTVNATKSSKWNAVVYLPALGTITVNGGTFESGNLPKEAHVFSLPYQNVAVTLNINGGKFLTKGADVFSMGTGTGAASGTKVLSITGGEYSTNPMDYLAEGYYPIYNTTTQLYDIKTGAPVKGGEVSYSSIKAALADGKTDIQLQGDLAEHVTIPAGKTVTLDLNGQTLSGGTDSGKPALLNNGTVTIKDSSNGNGQIRRDDQNTAGYYVIWNKGTMNISGGKFYNNTGTAPNGASLVCNVGTAATSSNLTITGGDFQQDGFIVIKNDDYGVLKIEGGTFTGTGSDDTYTISAVQNWADADITGGIFNGAIFTSVWSKNFPGSTTTIDGENVEVYGRIVIGKLKDYDSGEKVPKLELKNGKFDVDWFEIGDPSYIEVSGGSFTTDPGAYVVAGKVVVMSDKLYNVVEKKATAAEVAPPAVSAESKVNTADNPPLQEAVTKITGALTATGPGAPKTEIKGIEAAAAAAAQGNNVTPTNGHLDALKQLPSNSDLQLNDVKIAVLPIIDVVITDVKLDEGSAITSLTVDITPKLQTVATTAQTLNGNTEIKVAGTDVEGANAVAVGEPKEVKITTTVTVSIPLPEGFANADSALYIKHVKDNDSTYVYEAKVSADGKVATFTNPHGFSEITVTKTNPSVAKIGDVGYETLQAAVNDVPNNGTITLLKDNDETVTVSRAVTFTLVPGEFSIGAIQAGSSYRMQKDDNKYTFTRISSGGGGAATVSYKLTFETNGGAAIAALTRAAGTKIDLSAYTPKRDGYAFTGWFSDQALTDKITAVTLSKDQTVYAGWAEGTAPALPFTDVAGSDWFCDAVAYVYNNGVMTGVTGDRFAPNEQTTRGMIVTMLYRMEDKPETAQTAGFADVAPAMYYAPAIDWATAAAVVTGYSDTTFGPDDAITREQLAAILYRYAQYKKYDVSVGENTNILSYADAEQISEYAIPAIQWACGAQLMQGKRADILDPQGLATRAEVAAMLLRLAQNVA